MVLTRINIAKIVHNVKSVLRGLIKAVKIIPFWGGRDSLHKPRAEIGAADRYYFSHSLVCRTLSRCLVSSNVFSTLKHLGKVVLHLYWQSNGSFSTRLFVHYLQDEPVANKQHPDYLLHNYQSKLFVLTKRPWFAEALQCSGSYFAPRG